MHKHKWTWVVKYAPNWFGKHGFTQPVETRYGVYAINVGELDEVACKLLRDNKAVKEDGRIIINLVELGYNKVLGRGRVTLPLKVIVPEVTDRARRKIEEAGGEVVIAGEATK